MTQTEFEKIYHKLKHRVYNTVLSYLQQAEEAEEVTQDVFMEVFEHGDDFKGEAAIQTWVYRIAINKSIDFIKYKSRKKRFAFMTQLFEPESGELLHDMPNFEHPGFAIENKEKGVILFKAIEKLPEQQKTAFILSQVEGLSYKEISEVMEKQSGAIDSLIQRAKQNLRKELQNYFRA